MREIIASVGIYLYGAVYKACELAMFVLTGRSIN